MISIRGVSKKYTINGVANWVLKDIDIDIPDGVNVGLIGRNGAGKSTLLRLIGGMDRPDKGKIIRTTKVSWPIGLAGGFKGAMTGRQNVKFVARVHGIKENLTEIIGEIQEFAQIGKAFDQPVSTYSSGMKSRLSFGLSLAFKFDVYLSDEATSVGDRAFKKKAQRAFKDRVSGGSLIMVSHGEGVLKEMCEAGIYLANGKATWYDEIGDAIKQYHADDES
ncbi:ABC transporter ATP-binding protein [Salinicola endophyticus]|uniref:ABC transporter ATP-binding protein n=1 Tax=Salinicola endophyticus TaxID=1949083 RepID=A0ABY8FJ49_9GAMM|nr:MULTISPECIES: ABC transporter ATP-binding protein [Salinicola]WFF42652.1 ABC transporter ATP-binding protein [Salinicola endophyticus]